MQADRPAFQPAYPPGDPRRGAMEAGHGPAGTKPRVKMLETHGDLAPAGATYSPPTASPLPERGAGLHLLLSALAAIIAVVFFVLLAHKI